MKILGVLINSFDGSYQEALWKGLVKEAKKLGVSLIIYSGKPIESTMMDDAYHNSIYYNLPLERLDGLIIASAPLSNFISQTKFEKFLSMFKDIPIVSVGRKIPGIISILTDNYNSMKKMVEHLIDEHHLKKIAFLKGPECNYEAMERYKAYSDVMDSYGLTVDSSLVIEGDFEAKSGFDAVEILIDERQVTFEAIICANDGMAIGVLKELQSRGVKVPEEVVITGFDGNEDFEFILNEAPITTVKQPIYEMGQEAIRMLLDKIENRLVLDTKIIDGQCIFRKSCGCNNEITNQNSITKILNTELEKKISMQSLMWHMRSITTAISGTEDMETLKDVIESEFPTIGLKSFYLTLYQNTAEYNSREVFETPNFSKLIIGYEETGNLIPYNKEIIFSTRSFLPSEIFDFNTSFILMVEPLFNLEKQYGLMVHSLDEKGVVMHSSLREQVSSAIKTIKLSEARKDAEKRLLFTMQKLKHSEENFRKMAYLLPTLLFETNTDLNFTFLNKTTLDILGIDKNDLFNKSLLSYIDISAMEKLSKYCQRVINKGISNSYIEFKIKSKENKNIPILAKASPIIYEGEIEGYRWSAMNVKTMLGSITKTNDDFFIPFKFSKREREVLNLLLEGNKNRMIAEKLFIAESTVKDHLGAIYSKMNVKNRQALFMLLEEKQQKNLGPESFIFSIISRLIKE